MATSKLLKAQEWAEEAIGRKHKVRVNKNTVFSGTIIEAEAIADEQTGRPVCFKIMLKAPAGNALGRFMFEICQDRGYHDQ